MRIGEETFMMNDYTDYSAAYIDEGYAAFSMGRNWRENPYAQEDDEAAKYWWMGWRAGFNTEVVSL